jgi:hypothetical protein
MLHLLVAFLESRLSRRGRTLLRGMTTALVIGALIYLLNYLRVGYLGALTDAANAVE